MVSCTENRDVSPDTITVEGEVTVRGNEPFAAHLLETREHDVYVLDFAGGTAPPTPAHLRVTGRLYEDEWMGAEYLHIEVASIERTPFEPVSPEGPPGD